MTPTVALLHVSKPDWHLAVKFLAWTTWLAKQPNAQPYPLIVFTSQALSKPQKQALRAITATSPSVQYHDNPCTDESPHLGYARLANLALREALTLTERLFPGHPTLWVEADCIPIRPSWVGEIDAEYKQRARPFLGDFHALGPIPHLTGNAVYPPNWRKLAPSIAALPNPNPSQGWDTLCAHEIVPHSARSMRIQQAWETPPRRFTPSNLSVVHPDTALFHRCKDGSLIDVLARHQGCPQIPIPAPLTPITPTKAHRLMAPQVTRGR